MVVQAVLFLGTIAFSASFRSGVGVAHVAQAHLLRTPHPAQLNIFKGISSKLRQQNLDVTPAVDAARDLLDGHENTTIASAELEPDSLTTHWQEALTSGPKAMREAALAALAEANAKALADRAAHPPVAMKDTWDSLVGPMIAGGRLAKLHAQLDAAIDKDDMQAAADIKAKIDQLRGHA